MKSAHSWKRQWNDGGDDDYGGGDDHDDDHGEDDKLVGSDIHFDRFALKNLFSFFLLQNLSHSAACFAIHFSCKNAI